MIQNIFTFLKRNVTQDSFLINRIFVSIYIEYNKIDKYNHFIDKYVITEKNNDYGELIKVLSFLKSQHVEEIKLEDMINLFEFVISPSDRIVTGAIYTPKNIRDYLLGRCLDTFPDLCDVRVADIACGCGGFLMDAAKTIHHRTNKSYYDIFRQNIYGIDIQSYSIERCTILLNLLAVSDNEVADFDFNLLCADTLDFKSEIWDTYYSNFDVIVGNPPYVCGRNMYEDTKVKTKRYKVCDSGSTDLYIPFFQIAVEMLKDNGILGYITMNSFLKSLNARRLRTYFMDNCYDISIIDFRGHQIFKGKSTYTCLFFMEKKNSDVLHYCYNGNAKLNSQLQLTDIFYSSLNADKGWNLNENGLANKIESVGIPLFKYCQTRHGIATLSNKTYIFSPIKEDDVFYYLEKDNVIYPIEKTVSKNIVNSNKLNSDTSLEDILRKVIFPYHIDAKGKAILFEEDYFRNEFPCAYSYLESQRTVLKDRDKGKTQKYPAWYAYGRTQSLYMPSMKLFFPKIANKPLTCIIVNDPNLLLYNGMAFVGNDMKRMKVLQKVLGSNIFWNYVVANGKPYMSGYYSLNGANIKNFGVPVFTEEEECELIKLKNKKEINSWLASFYE